MQEKQERREPLKGNEEERTPDLRLIALSYTRFGAAPLGALMRRGRSRGQ
ncbi:hypothetical protein Dalk_2687 [Desulfatibacillum aliphaticivorans]|uniref:Uncharacterized protein n=1 Tax=Desulfatibacillum aliphaticivorans TaxID=218208 RepID=B8FIY8_DESAL|nr:hypothetical protein [Desulfatibacillum aliphaticivorans]ACL04379.1 hypothetical protein Dalk_2687 [Desulfatibacillum aliphaticivorans]